MRNRFKIILSVLASLLSLTAVTLIALPFMVDPNDFRAQIENSVSENTGRVFTVEGELELSVFPWLGISTGKLALANAPGFEEQPFAQIVESNIKIKLLPLLFREIEISEIVLKGLELNLSKNAQGQTNWADLVALLATKDESSKNPLKLLQIAGISIKHANISWDDQQTAQFITVKDVNLKTEKFAFDTAVATELSFSVHNRQPALMQTVNLSADLIVNEALDNIKLKHLKLKTLMEGKSIPTHKLIATLTSEASLDLKQQQLILSTLQLTSNELTLQGNVIAQLKPPFKIDSTVRIPSFNAAKFMQQRLAIPLPKMADDKALTWVAADFSLHVDSQQAKLDHLVVQVDETTVTGAVQVHDFTQPNVAFNLKLDILNADRYLPPPVAQAQNQATVIPDTGIAINSDLLPLESLRKLNANGQFTINDLKINNLTMQGIRFVLTAKQGVIQSLQTVDKLYQGAYSGKLALDVRSSLPLVSLTQQLSHVQVGALLTDLQGESKITGFMDANFHLASSGNSELALKSALNGRLQVLFKNTLIRGVNLQTIMDNSTIVFKEPKLASAAKKDFTAFSKIAATAVVSNGIVSNNDLSATAERLKITGFGTLNLLSRQINYKLISLLLKEKFALAQAKVVKNLPLFIKVSGNFTEPVYQVDLVAMGLAL